MRGGFVRRLLRFELFESSTLDNGSLLPGGCSMLGLGCSGSLGGGSGRRDAGVRHNRRRRGRAKVFVRCRAGVCMVACMRAQRCALCRCSAAVQTRNGLVVREHSCVHGLLRIFCERSTVGTFARDAARIVEGATFGHRTSGVRCARFVERPEQLGSEPDLVVLRVVAPGASQHDKLDLVGGMSHLA